MRIVCLALLAPLYCLANPQADHPHAREIQRALIERDRQSADFARGVPPQPLPPDAGRSLHPDPVIAREWRPYERIKAAEGHGHVLALPPPVVRSEKPLPLPGGARHGVEPIPATGVGG
ncbi:MAG TPA: hypothetical protein VD965_06165 [Burkholderiales bacterium]|nr:hypothetical protein [Burkholderiales bacterium]